MVLRAYTAHLLTVRPICYAFERALTMITYERNVQQNSAAQFWRDSARAQSFAPLSRSAVLLRPRLV